MRTMPNRSWIAILACFVIIISFLYWSYFSKPHLDEKRVSSVADQVYEVVVRDMLAPMHDGEDRFSQLVFDDTVLTYLTNRADTQSCEERARRELWLVNSKLPYNSLADKIYRLFSRTGYDDSLRADTIQDFLEKSCTAGRLSQTFHTDLPRTFVAAGSLHFKDWPIEKQGPPPFEQQFPGARGIVSFSNVGFDSKLNEAIVSVSFLCGGLCGSGHRYVLRKKSGRWGVVSKWMVWVS